jgi:hypothetical protein
MFYFLELFTCWWNRQTYYRQYLETLDEGWFPLCDVTTQKIYFFLANIVQMGHEQKDRPKAYWSTAVHRLRFLDFIDNKSRPGKTEGRLWKMRTIFDKLSDSYAKY